MSLASDNGKLHQFLTVSAVIITVSVKQSFCLNEKSVDSEMVASLWIMLQIFNSFVISVAWFACVGTKEKPTRLLFDVFVFFVSYSLLPPYRIAIFLNFLCASECTQH